MAAKQTRRSKNKVKKEIEELREIAFGVPDQSPFPQSIFYEIERDSIVRARVLLDCALVEEIAALAIMHFVLVDSKKWKEVKYFGRIKRYNIFYEDVLGRLPARHKVAVIKKFTHIPKSISKTIERMLALRGLFAHVYTIDDKNRNLEYKGENILSKIGFQSYMNDSNAVMSYLVKISKVL